MSEPTLFHGLVAVGEWAKQHPTIVLGMLLAGTMSLLAIISSVVLLLGTARFTWGSSVPHRRPWR